MLQSCETSKLDPSRLPSRRNLDFAYPEDEHTIFHLMRQRNIAFSSNHRTKSNFVGPVDESAWKKIIFMMKTRFHLSKWLILDVYKKTLGKIFGQKLCLSTGNFGLQKCTICFCAKHHKGVQISIQKQELRAAGYR